MRCLIFILLLFVAGCATPVREQIDTLSKRQVTLASFRDFPWQRLQTAKQTLFHLDENSPVYVFSGQKSYFAAFSLPATGAREIRVKSFFNGPLIGQFPQPAFLCLDNEFNPIEEFTINMHFIDAWWTEDAHMEALFEISPSVRYLIIYTREIGASNQTAGVKGSTGIMMVGNVPIISSSSGTNIRLSNSPTGALKIELDPTE